MAGSHKVIYVSGFGDHKRRAQNIILSYWRLRGMDVERYKMKWNDDKPYESKIEGLVGLIDETRAVGHQVSLIGVSAGATAVLNAYSRRKDKIWRVVYICGKLDGFDDIADMYFRRNPAYRDCVAEAEKSLQSLNDSDKAKMISMRPIADEIVYVRYTRIPGVRSKLILFAGHLPSIGVAMIFYVGFIIRFIKGRFNDSR